MKLTEEQRRDLQQKENIRSELVPFLEIVFTRIWPWKYNQNLDIELENSVSLTNASKMLLRKEINQIQD